MSKVTYTETEIKNWKKYERVRINGRFNMFDPNARLLTGLSEVAYMFCMKNYTELKRLVKEEI